MSAVTVRTEPDGKVGQPFCRSGSCIASAHPLTLEQHFTVCVCVGGDSKREGVSGPWEYRSKWAITALRYLINSALNEQILEEPSLCVCPLSTHPALSLCHFLSGVTVSWWRGCKVSRGGGCDAALFCNAGVWTAARSAPAWLLVGGNWQPAGLEKEHRKKMWLHLTLAISVPSPWWISAFFPLPHVVLNLSSR